MAEKELEKIVGSKNVLDSEEVLEEYSRDLSFVPRVRPRCVVKPKDTNEIEAIIKWANDTNTPLVPISSGAPHSRGDTVPSVGGAVLVDLSRMRQIVRIDRRNRVALIEPGVTFTELIPKLEQEGLVHKTGEGKKTKYEVNEFNVMKFLTSRVVFRWGKDKKKKVEEEKKDEG